MSFTPFEVITCVFTIIGWIYAILRANNSDTAKSIEKNLLSIHEEITNTNEKIASTNEKIADIQLQLQRIKSRIWNKEDLRDMIKKEIFEYHAQHDAANSNFSNSSNII